MNTQIKPYIIESTRFKTFFLELWFPYIKPKEPLTDTMLPPLLVHTNKTYKDEPSFSRAILERGILNITCGLRRIGKNYFLRCTLAMPDETVLSRKEVEEGISFFLNTIYDPNIEENTFDQSAFQRDKERMITSIENGLKHMDERVFLDVMDIVDTSGLLKDRIFKHLEEAKNMTGEKVCHFYREAIQKSRPFVFALGHFDSSQIEQYIEKELEKRNLTPIHIQKNYTCFLEPTPFIEKKVVGPYKQSCLVFVYKVKDMKEEDRIVLHAIAGLLSSSSSDLLLKMLRDEKDLVYEASTDLYSRFGMLMLEAKLYKDSYEEAKKQMYKTMDLLRNQALIEPLLQNIKERKRINLKRNLDSKNAIVDEQVDLCLGIDVSFEEEYERFCNISFNDIASLVNRLELNLIYFMEGSVLCETNETP